MVLAQQYKRPLFSLFVVVEIALVAVLSGCAQDQYFTASSLPVELTAQPLQSAQTINLSRFAGPPSDSTKISEGDILGISLAAGLSADEIVDFDVRVGAAGETLLPEIGRLPLGGLDATGAEKMIAAACVHRGLYRQPQVTVTVKEQRKNMITVVGAVKEPGVVELPRNSSNLVAAILAAGGIEENAGTKVEIRRPGGGPAILASDKDSGNGVRQASYEPSGNSSGVRQVANVGSEPQRGVEYVCLNLADPEKDSEKDTGLDDGSIVAVERLTPAPIEVTGLVKKPGQYEYPMAHEVRLLGAIAQAGGLSSKYTNKVIVIRKLKDGSGFVGIKANLKKAKANPAENLRIAPGDVICVEETPGTMLADTVNFVRFGIGASVPLF